MIRFLEANGYDVSYTSESEVDAHGSLLKPQDLHLQRPRRVLVGGAARECRSRADAGVNLAFFSGNEMFWKTRWGPSIDGSNTPYRTLVTYKETHFNARSIRRTADLDRHLGRSPLQPARRRRAAGERPHRPQFVVNSGTGDITVPAQYGKLRLWRNTRRRQPDARTDADARPGHRHARL